MSHDLYFECHGPTYLEVPPVHPDGRLLERHGADKLEVERPDPVMLGDGHCPQGAVERPARPGDLALVHQELAVVQPDSRHLEDKGGI